MSTTVKQLKASTRPVGGQGGRTSRSSPGPDPGRGSTAPASAGSRSRSTTRRPSSSFSPATSSPRSSRSTLTAPRPRPAARLPARPVKDTPLHIDFLRLKAGQAIRVEVPVHFINQETGSGHQARRHAQRRAPHNRDAGACGQHPESFTVDLAGLDINDSVHISAVKLPENCKPVITERDFTRSPPSSLPRYEGRAGGPRRRRSGRRPGEGRAGQEVNLRPVRSLSAPPRRGALR